MARTVGATPRNATYSERIDFGSAVAWIYRYRNETPIEHRAVGAGLEFAVQLRGEWRHRGRELGGGLYGPATIHRINNGEPYDMRFSAPGDEGVQVGFIVYPHTDEFLRSAEGEIAFVGDAGATDRELYEFARWFHEGGGASAAGVAPEVHDVLRRYIRRHGVVRPPDPLLVAKREIERDPRAELYVEHLAELAGLHPVTFSRKFRRRYGVTPVRYRLYCRLNHAARLTWARPDLRLAEIAERAGFHDLPYFFREFRKYLHSTPAAYGRRKR
jgi:AraC-like DNA-binding protein